MAPIAPKAHHQPTLGDTQHTHSLRKLRTGFAIAAVVPKSFTASFSVITMECIFCSCSPIAPEINGKLNH